MKIIAYLRVSTDEQAQSEAGLNAQRDAINAHLAITGQTATAVFTDAGISGTAELGKRTGLLDAVNALRKGDSLIVQKRDRLGRDVVLLKVIETEITKRGAKVISLNGSNEQTPEASLLNGMLDVMARYEVELIRARTKAALQAKKARNERMGKLPYGYRVASDNIHLKPNPKEQAILRRIAELRKAGLYQREIAQRLNQEQLFNRRGQPWNQPMIHLLLKRLDMRLVKE